MSCGVLLSLFAFKELRRKIRREEHTSSSSLRYSRPKFTRTKEESCREIGTSNSKRDQTIHCSVGRRRTRVEKQKAQKQNRYRMSDEERKTEERAPSQPEYAGVDYGKGEWTVNAKNNYSVSCMIRMALRIHGFGELKASEREEVVR
jgi:hypothetical protein